MKINALLLVFMTFSSLLYGQNPDQVAASGSDSIVSRMDAASKSQEEFNPRKNSIYITGGIIGLNASYERLIAKTPNGVFNTLWFRIGGGIFAVPTEMGGPLAVTSLHTLTGKKRHHMEMNLGAFTFYDITNESWKFLPAAGLGYRYQQLNSGLLLRIGISLPEYAYLGVGYCF